MRTAEEKFHAAFAVFFAVLLQIQASLFQTDTYDGLRISAGDFLVASVVPVILLSLLLRRGNAVEWKKPFRNTALVLMTVVMTFALLNGFFLHDGLSQWAVLNKYAGWFMLLAYFGSGAWLAANDGPRFIPVFLRAFCFFTVLVLAAETGNQLLRAFSLETGWRHERENISGLMGNRNAFAFLLLTVSAFVTLDGFKKPGPLLYVFWILLPIGLIFNGSRALFLAMPVLLAVFTVMDWRKTLKIILPCFAGGAVLFFILFSTAQKEYFGTLPFRTAQSLAEFAQNPADPETVETAKAYGNAQRVNILRGAFNLIKIHPLEGAGLGSALRAQQDEGSNIDIIDSTPVWILTEMGIVGFAVFAGSFALMAAALFRAGKQDDMNKAALLLMLCFALFSPFHEILYTRFLWFILGLALAVPKTRQQPQEI